MNLGLLTLNPNVLSANAIVCEKKKKMNIGLLGMVMG